MNTALWVGQGILAAAFLYSGINKSLRSEKELVAMGQTGVEGLSAGLIFFIGLAEVAGATGIVLPWWTGILPVLTPVAAICFALIMILAAPIHYRRKEPGNVFTNLSLLAISLFVAYGRFRML